MNTNNIIKLYSDAKEIYALVRKKKMSKTEIFFDFLVELFTPMPGIVDGADLVSDLGTYYLIIGDSTNKLVRVMGGDITEQELSVNCQKRTFIVNGNRFTKAGKLYGTKL